MKTIQEIMNAELHHLTAEELIAGVHAINDHIKRLQNKRQQLSRERVARGVPSVRPAALVNERGQA
jgi:hypothetical protein